MTEPVAVTEPAAVTEHSTGHYVPFTVTARLGSPVAWSAPWGIALDGLLAAQLRDDAKAAARDAGTDYPLYDPNIPPQDVELPLARCTRAGMEDWHWAATFAHPVGEVPGPHVAYWTARPDQYALDQMSDELPALVSARQGRYRARVMPLPVTVAHSLTWRGVGDPGAVRTLLHTIPAVGKKRSAGHGHVLDWTVTAAPAGPWWEYAHLHSDGTLGRTAPRHCLSGRSDVITGDRAETGVRPPYMHPATRRAVLLPATGTSRSAT